MESGAYLGGRAVITPLVCHTDSRGALLPFDFATLPFEPRRIFVVNGVPVGTTRGGHAHKSCRQLLICVAGSIRIDMQWERRTETVRLDRSDLGVLIEPGVWASETYEAPGTILLVLASEPYMPQFLTNDGGELMGLSGT
jgi:hypothetical protein